MQTGVDVGGTFTDVVVWHNGALVTGKVPTTADQSDGVLEGLTTIAGGNPGALLHGTTTATNAILERNVARTALITDAGFEDLLEIGRQNRPSLYDTSKTRAAPLVDRIYRLGVPGRSGPAGRPSGDLADLDAVIDRLRGLEPEAVAVSLLYSFVDGSREREIAARLGPSIPVSLSSDVVAEFREYERASTTVINASLLPTVERYLSALAAKAASAGVEGTVAVMRSSGGLISAAEAARLPASILLSGPAGGVVAAVALGRALGRDHLISFDMGGTSTDVCRIDHGRPEVQYERSIDDLPCRLPSVAIHTVGAGGGSIGWIDAGGALRVGPRSAGAIPGPACYGRGGLEAAVTDANLLLGRISADARLAGTLMLNPTLARTALQRLGTTAGLEPSRAALGMVEIVEAHMQRAVRRVSVEEGADPRQATLVAFGGAGGLHATALARRLDMAGVLIAPYAGVFSALGLLLAPPRADVARSVLVTVREGFRLDPAVEEIRAAAELALQEAGAGTVAAVKTYADVRYLGQSHETTVGYDPGEGWAALEERFHRAHRQRNGFARVGDPIEVVTVRAEATGHPVLEWEQVPEHRPSGAAERGERDVLTTEGVVKASGWWRPGLAAGSSVVGPAVLEEPEATTFLASGERATVHPSGALEVEW